MPKVISRKTITFPKLRWGINAGETRELPKDKDVQKVILASNYITLVEKEKSGDIDKSKK